MMTPGTTRRWLRRYANPTDLQRNIGWQDRAACRGQPEVMFPTAGQSTDRAKAICAACPVIDTCLTWVMAVEDGAASHRGGIYGGLDPAQRARLAAAHGRGQRLALDNESEDE